jgi:hypothetical protein
VLPKLSTYQFNYGNGSTAPHFGIEATSGTPIDVLAQYWTYANSTTSELPNLGFASRLPGAGATRYAVFFANVGFAGGGAPQGVWDEFAFSGATPHVVVTNTTDPTETLSNFGYFISDTELPLDFQDRVRSGERDDRVAVCVQVGADANPGRTGSVEDVLVHISEGVRQLIVF